MYPVADAHGVAPRVLSRRTSLAAFLVVIAASVWAALPLLLETERVLVEVPTTWAFVVAVAAPFVSDRFSGTLSVGGTRVVVALESVGIVVAACCLPLGWCLLAIVAGEIAFSVLDRARSLLYVLSAAFSLIKAGVGLAAGQVVAVHLAPTGAAGSAIAAVAAGGLVVLVDAAGAAAIARRLEGSRSADVMAPVVTSAVIGSSMLGGTLGLASVYLLRVAPGALLVVLPAAFLAVASSGRLVEVQGHLQRVSLGRKFLAALNRADDDDHTSVDEALEEFRELLNVTFVALVDNEGERAAQALAADVSVTSEPESVIELTHEAQPLGRLLVGAKRNGQPLDEADQETLESNAGQLATWLAKWKLAAQVEYMATHDQLTGLLNRIGLDRAIMADADTGITKGAVMLLDLDNFRQLNDTLGHHAGDELLELVADRIRSVVGPKTALARLGGDEFAVWIPLIDDDEMSKVAKDVLESINEPVQIHENPLHIEGSVGVVLYPDHGDNTTDLIRRADVAMYIAKDAHLGVMRYDPTIDPHSAERLRVLGELRDALNEGALVVHYQPKYELESNRIVGVESLVRWQQRDGTMVPPGKFIDAAERSGLIGPIFEFVLRTSLLQIRTWDRMGMQLNASVNMSARNLADPTVIETIERALIDYGVPAGQLTIELTERDLPANSGSAAAMLNYLTSTGIKVSLDDFGTGQQSYVHLTQLPIDEIKIDQTFVKKIASSPLNQGIVESLVHVARRGRLQAVAEGIEDAETLDLLREMGCQFGQGYHLCRPAGAEVITEVIVNNHSAVTAAV